MVTERELIDPVEVTIDGIKFVIGHVPAFEADGLYDKLFANKGVPPEDVKRRLLSFVILKSDKGSVNLDNEAIVNEYIKKWGTLRKLINKCIDTNFDFLEDGATSQD